MELICRPSTLTGSVAIPGSKSHTIRGVLLASLAAGESRLLAPLNSADTEAAMRVYSALGATFDRQGNEWLVRGTGGRFLIPEHTLDAGNSGTTLRVALGSLSLLPEGEAIITGDEQIRSRPSQPLAAALNELGAQVEAINANGCAPFRVRGVLRGGRTSIECETSQYLTSLLLACPLAAGDSELEVPLLNEKAYAGITLDWLKFMGIEVEHDPEYKHFRIPGGQQYKPFTRRIPADLSSATFFLVAGALGGNDISCRGLDLEDAQPDKAVIDYLRAMGADISVTNDAVRVQAKELNGVELDLNETPDALPMLAVAGCFARGETRLVNVPQARIKETDRIAVMCRELRKLGADVEELPAGLVVRCSRLRGAALEGHQDHRVVMALAIAGTLVPGETRISTAEAASVTFPQFTDFLENLGADLEIRHELR